MFFHIVLSIHRATIRRVDEEVTVADRIDVHVDHYH